MRDEISPAQGQMNTCYQSIVERLLNNAERDLRLAHAEADAANTAKAQARYDTLEAALEIYAAAHKLAYGARPWPRPGGQRP